MYAIVEANGHQYRVTPGGVLKLEANVGVAGEKIEFDRVVLLADGESVKTGTPTVPGAKVVATVQETGRDKKIKVFKYKRKVRYRRRFGHRQDYTKLTVNEIVTGN